VRAVWQRARAELRNRWRATLGLALLVGLVAGVAIASAAGARRTASAYPRFLAASNAADVLVNPDLGVFTELDFDAVAALPEVEEMSAVAGLIVVTAGADGEPHFAGAPLAVAAVDGRGFSSIERPKLVEGRLPDPNRADEVYVNPALAASEGLVPGAELTLFTAPTDELYAAEEAGTLPSFDKTIVTVTGIAVGGDEMLADEAHADDGRLVLTPAFYREHDDSVFYWGLYADLAGNDAALASFRSGVERLAGDEAIEFQTSALTTATVQRAIRPQAVALAFFAAVVGFAGLLMAGQAIARSLASDAGDGPALHALGMTRRQRVAVSLLRVGVVAGGGAVVAGALAVALSPLFPIGVARLAEPHPGVAVDMPAVGVGALILAVLLPAALLVPAWRIAGVRRPGPDTAPVTRPSWASAALARAGASPSSVAGVRMALEPGGGRTAVPARSMLAGAGMAVACVLAAVTFAASLNRMLSTPHLYGWAWDVMVTGGDGEDEAIAGAVADRAAALVDDPAVTALAAGNVGRLSLPGGPVAAVGLDQLRGQVSPPILAGRMPASDDEIALGGRTLERLGLDVGDQVDVSAAGTGEVVPLRIVGRAVFVNFATYAGSDSTKLGEGALVTTTTLARLGPTFVKPFLLVALAEHADGATAAGDDADGLLDIVDAPRLPAEVVDFDRVRTTPLVLAGVLAVLASATVVQALVSSVRRRRRDLALLGTLGFVRRQISSMVAWQATTVALVALAAGVPLGMAAGRWAWTLVAEELGIAVQPVTPVAALLAVPATVVLANLAAAGPARMAARIHPAVALRSE
jgi:hypothetical protein